jgi:hypothetical protein
LGSLQINSQKGILVGLDHSVFNVPHATRSCKCDRSQQPGRGSREMASDIRATKCQIAVMASSSIRVCCCRWKPPPGPYRRIYRPNISLIHVAVTFPHTGQMRPGPARRARSTGGTSLRLAPGPGPGGKRAGLELRSSRESSESSESSEPFKSQVRDNPSLSSLKSSESFKPQVRVKSL